MGILARDGYELTPRADEAEVLVVNTCSFIEAGAEGIHRHHSGNGRAQEIRRGEKIDCRRMPGGALSRANSRTGAGSGRGRRHRRSRTHSGSGAKATCDDAACRGRRRFSITISRRAWSPRRGTPRTSKSPKAAIIPARSASFRSCAENSAAADSNPWCAKRKIWRRRACAKSR